MRRLVVVFMGMSLSLAGAPGAILAQESNVQGISTNADGADVTSTSGVNPTADGEGGTIVYGDINTGPGYTVVGPPAVVRTGATMPPAVTAPAPAPEAMAEPGATEPVVAGSADLDADNYADDLERDLGLDPNIADTDGDAVADGDELNLYGAEPTLFDTDGDGVSDGEELFALSTDPLIWEDFSAEASNEPGPQVAESQPAQTSESDSVALAQETTEDVTAIDGDAAALGPGSASASPGSVTRGVAGNALLGPDGTYNVTEVAPPNVSVSGDTDVISITPAAERAAPPAAVAPESSVADCSSYASWYDAQVSYEAAGMTSADPAIVAALDPDYDGIACEEAM